MADLVEWASELRKDKYLYGADHVAIDHVVTLLKGERSPAESAGAIAATYEPGLLDGSFSRPGYFLLGIFQSAARTLGSSITQAQRLGQLWSEIAQLPEILDKHGQPVRAGSYENFAVYWRGMPGFWMAYREYGMFEVYGGIGEGWPEDPNGDWFEYGKPLLNASRVGAMCLHCSKDTRLVGYAGVALRGGLDSSFEQPEDRAGENAIAFANACVWLIHAGEDIFRACHSSTQDPEWESDRFSREKWDMWKEQVQYVTGISNLDARVKEMGDQALAEMDRMERANPPTGASQDQ